MKKLGVVTVARSDYGIYQPVLKKLSQNKNFDMRLLVSGMHLAEKFGMTINDIRRDGYPIEATVETPMQSDAPEAVSHAMGLGLSGFAQVFAKYHPDILFVLGDRFEMHAAALAALPFRIPLAHLHGGEVTEGAIDESLRHSITKLSHLHFATTQEHGRRVRQLGEESWRITVTGAPALDHLKTMQFLTPKELSERVEMPLDSAPLLVTYHPVTLEYQSTDTQIQNLITALKEFKGPMIVTGSNADTHHDVITQHIEAYVKSRPQTRYIPHLGSQAYFSLMRIAAAMVGNSSSGIIEAPSFRLPVVNVGNRQRGRTRAGNVIDVSNASADIAQGIRQALSPEFRNSLASLVNPYGEGRAADLINQVLERTEINERLIMKHFADLPMAPRPQGITETV